MSGPKGIPAAAVMQNEDVRRFIGDIGMPGNIPQQAARPEFLGYPNPPAPALTPPAPQSVPEQAAETQAEAAVAKPPEDPNEAYLKELERLKISKAEAAKIVDSMLFKNMYEEDVQLTKKLSVRFRTRGQEAIDRLNAALEQRDVKFNGSVYALIAEYNIAASLVQYGPHTFDPTNDEGVERTRKYIKSLPSPVFGLIATKLSKFDEKCSAVMTEGAVENFF